LFSAFENFDNKNPETITGSGFEGFGAQDWNLS